MRQDIPLLAYAVVAATILGPALMPGYILVFDMIFTPTLQMPSSFTNLSVFLATTHIINLLIPAWIIQKLILLAIFTAAGLGMHRLVGLFTTNPWAQFAAGLFFVLNPFTYGRLMAGQFLVLAGYALLPWLAAALLRWLKAPHWKTGLAVGAWLVGISLVSLHVWGFGILLTGLATMLGIWKWRRFGPELRRFLVTAAIAAGALLIASSYWLVPLATQRSSQAQLIGNFDERHFLSFRTASAPVIGVPGNVLGLYGFWAEREKFFVSSKTALPPWWLVGLLILAVALAGGVFGWRRNRLAVVLFGGTLVIGWVLAQGITNTPFAQLNHLLSEHVPLYRGYREPAKFVALVALAEAFFFGLGVAWLLARVQKWPLSAQILPGLLVALPLIYTPTMLWGAGGQLRAVDYPRDWYALNRKLGSGGGKMLFLPWHQYMYFDFARHVVANPAPRFFDRPTIGGDNAEIGLIKRQISNPISEKIESEILATHADRTKIGERLSHLNIEYITLAKAADYQAYQWLGRSPDLKLMQNTNTLVVYRNIKWRMKP